MKAKAEGKCPMCDASGVIEIDLEKRTRHVCPKCCQAFFFYPKDMEARPTVARYELIEKGRASPIAKAEGKS